MGSLVGFFVSLVRSVSVIAGQWPEASMSSTAWNDWVISVLKKWRVMSCSVTGHLFGLGRSVCCGCQNHLHRGHCVSRHVVAFILSFVLGFERKIKAAEEVGNGIEAGSDCCSGGDVFVDFIVELLEDVGRESALG